MRVFTDLIVIDKFDLVESIDFDMSSIDSTEPDIISFIVFAG